MHGAPSVTYPVGRSRGATRILVVLWALGALCAGASCYLFDSAGWRHVLLVASVLFAGVAAGFGLRQEGAGVLLRRLDTGLGESAYGVRDEVTRRGHSPSTAVSLASRSASTHESITGCRSPSRTWSRL